MIYTQILDFDNYFIGEDLKIYSDYKGTKKELKQYKRRDGYYGVMLYKDHKGYRKLVHRLIAEAFIPNPDNKPCIDHINGIRDDNCIENLRWCTFKENNSFPLAHKHRSEAMKKKHKEGIYDNKYSLMKGRIPKANPPKQLIRINIKTGETIIYNSCSEAAKVNKVSPASISEWCNGKHSQRYAEYKWQYLD